MSDSKVHPINAHSAFKSVSSPNQSAQQQLTHVHETIKLLLLSMAQIELSLTDGEQNMSGLGQLFTDMATHQQQVNDYLKTKQDTPAEILLYGQQLADKVNEGVIAFQFYDRLSQRLQHVTTGLGLTEEILADDTKRGSRLAWQRVNEEIKQTYSLECEKHMFDCVLKGVPLHEALEQYRALHSAKEEQDDIELF
ncbi:hypothetical protein [Shewanella sp. WXL01]|uniref:hypothetical protein n=1 Tax=Shewanella sp. WXL01 TaxID=2709721 RepID=UPI001AEC6FE9|nr:hypothetical protein [Shewanella sp. WXL01]